jgi:hypothetical protein
MDVISKFDVRKNVVLSAAVLVAVVVVVREKC